MTDATSTPPGRSRVGDEPRRGGEIGHAVERAEVRARGIERARRQPIDLVDAERAGRRRDRRRPPRACARAPRRPSPATSRSPSPGSRASRQMLVVACRDRSRDRAVRAARHVARRTASRSARARIAHSMRVRRRSTGRSSAPRRRTPAACRQRALERPLDCHGALLQPVFSRADAPRAHRVAADVERLRGTPRRFRVDDRAERRCADVADRLVEEARPHRAVGFDHDRHPRRVARDRRKRRRRRRAPRSSAAAGAACRGDSATNPDAKSSRVARDRVLDESPRTRAISSAIEREPVGCAVGAARGRTPATTRRPARNEMPSSAIALACSMRRGSSRKFSRCSVARAVTGTLGAIRRSRATPRSTIVERRDAADAS